MVARGINVVVGNGFLGTAITSELRLRQPTIVLSRNSKKHNNSSTDIVSTDFAHSLRCLKNIDTLFWAAGPSSPFKVEQQPNLALEHISYVTNILSRLDAKKIIYCSSGGTIYGNYEPGIAAMESHSPKPISVYGKMHMEIENSLQGLPNVTCLRIANIYGKGQRAAQQQGLVSHAIHSALLRIPLDIYGTGNETRDYISIDVLAQQISALSTLKTPTLLNLGTGVATSTNQILDLISEYIGVKIKTTYHPRRIFDVEHNFLDISQLRKLTSTDVRPIEETIPLLIDSMR